MLITLQVGSSVTVNNISSSKLLNIVKKINLNFFSIHFFLSRNNGNTFGALEQSICFVGLSFKENIILFLINLLLTLVSGLGIKKIQMITYLVKKEVNCMPVKLE